MSSPLRVIQCGTGTAGLLALRAIIDSPQLELAGLLVTSPEKVGRDAGDIADRPPTGIVATEQVESLFSSRADCVCYMLLTPDLEHISGFLQAGKRVATTAGLMHPALLGGDVVARLESACARGSSALYVTGINPGWVDETLPLTMAQLCRDIDTVTIQEYADCGRYPAPHILTVMGFGKTPEQIAAEEAAGGDLLGMMRSFFRQSVAALAADLDCPIEEVRETRDFVLAEHGYNIRAGHIPGGTVAGQRWRWCGIQGGRERVIQETYWFTAFGLGEGYPEEGDLADDTLWRVTIEGNPSLRCSFEPRVSFRDGGRGGDNPSALATAMAAVNALPALQAAPTGLLTPSDLLMRSLLQGKMSGN